MATGVKRDLHYVLPGGGALCGVGGDFGKALSLVNVTCQACKCIAAIRLTTGVREFNKSLRKAMNGGLDG